MYSSNLKIIFSIVEIIHYLDIELNKSWPMLFG